MKLFKYLTYLVLVLIIGAAGALVVGPNYVDWNQHKAQIEDEIWSQTGYHVELVGPIEFKLLPQPVLALGGVRVKPFQGEQDIMTAGPVQVTASLSKLLMLQIAIEKASVADLQVHLVRDAEGHTNWQPQRHNRGLRHAKSLYPLAAFGQTEIRNAALFYQDAQAGVDQQFTEVNVAVQAPTLAETRYTVAGLLNGVPVSVKGLLNASSLHQMSVEEQLTVPGAESKFSGAIFEPTGNLVVSGNFGLKADAPVALLKKLKLVQNVPAIELPKTDFSGQITLGDGQLGVDEGRLRYGEKTEITGDLKVQDKGTDKPLEVKLEAQASNLNLDALLGGVMAAPTADSHGDTPWSDDLIDLTFLQQVNGSVDLQVNNLQLMQRQFRQAALRANLDAKELSLEKLEMAQGKGSLKAIGRIGFAHPNVYQLNLHSTDLPLAELMDDSLLTGNLNLTADFSSRGESSKEIASNLKGTANFSVNDGILHGVKIDDLSVALQSLFKGNLTADKTTVKTLSATATVDKGVLRNEDLTLVDGEGLTLSGSGKLDLGSWTINYKLRPSGVNDITRVIIPVRLSGRLNDPEILPDVMSPQGAGAALGAAVGGPIGAGVGMAVGSFLSDAGEAAAPAPQPKAAEPKKPPLPFDFKDKSNLEQNVRKYLDSKK